MSRLARKLLESYDAVLADRPDDGVRPAKPQHALDFDKTLDEVMAKTAKARALLART